MVEMEKSIASILVVKDEPKQLKLYVKFAIPLMALGLLLTYFLLADPYAQIPGLGLGAVGLPIRSWSWP